MSERVFHDKTELLDYFGCETFEKFERAVYKGTACGVWVQELTDGIEIGSIVEGSDVEIGPFDLQYPFSTEEFDEVLDEVNQIATVEWNYANLEEKTIKLTKMQMAEIVAAWYCEDPMDFMTEYIKNSMNEGFDWNQTQEITIHTEEEEQYAQDD